MQISCEQVAIAQVDAGGICIGYVDLGEGLATEIRICNKAGIRDQRPSGEFRVCTWDADGAIDIGTSEVGSANTRSIGEIGTNQYSVIKLCTGNICPP